MSDRGILPTAVSSFRAHFQLCCRYDNLSVDPCQPLMYLSEMSSDGEGGVREECSVGLWGTGGKRIL